MKLINNDAVNAAIRIVFIYLAATGVVLALIRFLNLRMLEWNIDHLYVLQDLLFLCLTASLLFILYYLLTVQLHQNNQLTRQNELRYHSIFNNMHKGGAVYCPVDQGKNFVFVDINCSGEQIDQVNRQRLIGRRVTEIFPGIRESNLLNVMQRVHTTGNPEYLPISLYRDKCLQSCRENYLFRLDSGEIAAMYDDVTEKKQLQEKLEQSKGELTLQNKIITQFLTTGEDTVYQVVLHIIMDALQSRFGVFGYLNEQGSLICPTLTSEYQELYKIEAPDLISSPKKWSYLWGRALREGKTMLRNSSLDVPVGHISLQNGLVVPIQYLEETIGILCIANKDEDYTNTNRTLLESICSYLAPILNARLHAQYSENLRFETMVELVKSEASLKEAEKVAKIGHWEHHFATGALSWSDEVYRIFSQDPKQFKPSVQALLEQVHPDDRELVKKAFTAAMTNKTGYDEIIHRLLLADGTIKFVHERWVATYNNNGEPVQSLGTVQDITERIQAEESSRRLATAIDQAVDVIMITDEHGTIQYVNPAFEKLTGYTREEAVGKNSRILKSGKHSPTFYEDLWATIKSGIVWHGRFVNRSKKGELFTEETTITPVKDDKGHIINFVAVKHDISRELELEKQLRQAVKMEAIGTLAGGIAHDFNNILGAILGYTRMAMDTLPQESQPHRDLEKVIQSGDRAASLVQQILLFSRRQEEGFVPVQVEFLIKEAVKMLRATLPASIVLEETIEPHCPSILADPAQIHQILMNLCTNAKQSMLAKGGTLTITLSKQKVGTDDQTTPANLSPGQYVKLSIRDTGTGIAADDLPRIFDPFFTTKGVGEGTGLGLAVVHGIIKSHRGTITVDSVLHQGTTFTLFLPVSAKENKIVTLENGDAIPNGNEHILVVDDEPDILIIRQRILNSLGYRVTTFSSSIEALSSFRHNPLQYDLVLTDMNMPIKDGKTLTVDILDLRPDIPVILCTGYSDLINEQTASEYGMKAILKKPITPMALAKTIRKVLDNGTNSNC